MNTMAKAQEKKFSNWHCNVTVKYQFNKDYNDLEIREVTSEIPDDIVVMRRIVDYCMARIRELKKENPPDATQA